MKYVIVLLVILETVAFLGRCPILAIRNPDSTATVGMLSWRTFGATYVHTYVRMYVFTKSVRMCVRRVCDCMYV